MGNKKIEDNFIGILDGGLAEKEKNSCLSEIEQSPELKRNFQEYKGIYDSLKLVSEEEFLLEESFADKVMETLEGKSRFPALSRLFRIPPGMAPLAGAVAMCAALLVLPVVFEIQHTGRVPDLTQISGWAPAAIPAADNQAAANQLFTFISGLWGTLTMGMLCTLSMLCVFTRRRKMAFTLMATLIFSLLARAAVASFVVL